MKVVTISLVISAVFSVLFGWARVAKAATTGDSLEASAGYGLLNLYGTEIVTDSSSKPSLYGRYTKSLGQKWGVSVDYVSLLGTNFGGFSGGVSYDLSSALMADDIQDVSFDNGVLIERFSYWRFRVSAGLGRWSYSGVVRSSAETRIRNRVINVDMYGVSLSALVDRHLTKHFGVHVGAGWLTGFASGFGAQQLGVFAGLGWLEI
jgi:hypothetical protein